MSIKDFFNEASKALGVADDKAGTAGPPSANVKLTEDYIIPWEGPTVIPFNCIDEVKGGHNVEDCFDLSNSTFITPGVGLYLINIILAWEANLLLEDESAGMSFRLKACSSPTGDIPFICLSNIKNLVIPKGKHYSGTTFSTMVYLDPEKHAEHNCIQVIVSRGYDTKITCTLAHASTFSIIKIR